MIVRVVHIECSCDKPKHTNRVIVYSQDRSLSCYLVGGKLADEYVKLLDFDRVGYFESTTKKVGAKLEVVAVGERVHGEEWS